MEFTTVKELNALRKVDDNVIEHITKSLNTNFSKGLISEELCETSFNQLDTLISKAGVKKYFKREGSPGNYKYYYTEKEYRQAKSAGGKKEASDKEKEKKYKITNAMVQYLDKHPAGSLKEHIETYAKQIDIKFSDTEVDSLIEQYKEVSGDKKKEGGKEMSFREVLADKEGRSLVDTIEEYKGDLRDQPGREEHMSGLRNVVGELEKKTGYKYDISEEESNYKDAGKEIKKSVEENLDILKGN